MKTPRIIAVHLLNDFSGSPFVLRQALEVMVQMPYPVHLYTATPSGKGFLTDINGVQLHPLFYKWHRFKWLTLFYFFCCQLYLFTAILFRVRRTDLVYVNSILPFGAALAARLRGAKVIYHIHEVSVKPRLLKNFLVWVAGLTAFKAVFVSEDVRRRTSFKNESVVIYNSLPLAFIQEAAAAVSSRHNQPFTVLMLCSLKAYKGVWEFTACAQRLPAYRFQLVLNASQDEINAFFKEQVLPSNLQLYPAQQNVHPFYQEADLVVNLSLPDQWVETFGMTILEAMFYKKPVMIPDTGGITELVTDECEGYRVNPRDLSEVCSLINMLATHPQLYERMSVQAFKKAKRFSPAMFSKSIRTTVQEAMESVQPAAKPVGVQLRLF